MPGGLPAEGSSLPYHSFDRVARDYEATRPLPLEAAETVARLVTDGLRPEHWALDAGVGTGRLGRALAARHARTVGVDVSREMLAVLRSGSSQILYPALADLRSLPFADSTFQRVLSVHVLHLIIDWRRALTETWRVLTPGGKLYLGVEKRQQAEVRDYFLGLAEVRGLLPPALGAQAHDVVRALREDYSAEVVEHREAAGLQWETQVPVRETLNRLARRTYSVLWSIPDENLNEMLEETRRWAVSTFGSLDHSQTISGEMILFAARKR